jgi:hypothetical protein
VVTKLEGELGKAVPILPSSLPAAVAALPSAPPSPLSPWPHPAIVLVQIRSVEISESVLRLCSFDAAGSGAGSISVNLLFYMELLIPVSVEVGDSLFRFAVLMFKK